MTPSIPFQHAYGQTLREFIAEHTGGEVNTGESQGETEGLAEARAHFLLDEIRGLEERSHRAMPARLLQAARQRLEARLLADLLAAEWDLSRRGDIAVRNSGSLSHVYFNVTPRPMDLSEVALLYPSLLDLLVKHEGIDLVVGRDGQDVVIAGSEGKLRIGAAGQQLEGKDPLDSLPDPGWAIEQMMRVARFPHAGDLILLGAWNGEQVISFEEQVATHGGLGGPQDWPFLAYPLTTRLAVEEIENSEAVYAQLAAAYGDILDSQVKPEAF
jgi:hypothetical protein